MQRAWFVFALATAVGAPSAYAQEGESNRAPFFSFPGLKQPTMVARSQKLGGICHDCDLTNRRLPDLRIERGDFSGARFVGAFLVGMEASGSVFVGADFSLANLSGAAFADVTADQARFGGSRLIEVNFSRASLRGTDFTNSELSNGAFVQAVLEDARLSGANLAGASFLRANLRRANFSYARLGGADFTHADMTGADLSNANLTGANLGRARNLAASALSEACSDGGAVLPASIRARVRLRACED